MDGGDGATSALDVLYSEIQRLVRAESESEICEAAVDAVPAVFDAPFSGLWLYDSEAVELQLTAETERAKRVLDDDIVYRPGNSLSWEAFETGELRRFPQDADESQQYNDDTHLMDLAGALDRIDTLIQDLLTLAEQGYVVEAHGWEITAGESAQQGARFEVIGDVKPVTPFETE